MKDAPIILSLRRREACPSIDRPCPPSCLFSCGRPITQQAGIDQEALEAEEKIQLTAAFDLFQGTPTPPVQDRLPAACQLAGFLRKGHRPQDRRDLPRPCQSSPEEYREVAADVHGYGPLPMVEMIAEKKPCGQKPRCALATGLLRLMTLCLRGTKATTLSAMSPERYEKALGRRQGGCHRQSRRRDLGHSHGNRASLQLPDPPAFGQRHQRLCRWPGHLHHPVGIMSISDDRELAFVISHELAHNAMGHVGRQGRKLGGRACHRCCP